MIAATRLNGERFYLNPDLIETFEESPGTVVTLVDGKHVRVKEPAATLLSAITVWRASIIAVSAQITRPDPALAREDADTAGTDERDGNR